MNTKRKYKTVNTKHNIIRKNLAIILTYVQRYRSPFTYFNILGVQRLLTSVFTLTTAYCYANSAIVASMIQKHLNMILIYEPNDDVSKLMNP